MSLYCNLDNLHEMVGVHRRNTMRVSEAYDKNYRSV